MKEGKVNAKDRVAAPKQKAQRPSTRTNASRRSVETGNKRVRKGSVKSQRVQDKPSDNLRDYHFEISDRAETKAQTVGQTTEESDAIWSAEWVLNESKHFKRTMLTGFVVAVLIGFVALYVGRRFYVGSVIGVCVGWRFREWTR